MEDGWTGRAIKMMKDGARWGRQQRDSKSKTDRKREREDKSEMNRDRVRKLYTKW